jgi:uncharacterized membrane protein
MKQKLYLALLVMSLLGLYASFGLIIDKLALVQNKDFIVACNINPLFSCTQVMNTPYADMFGFPNPIFGLIGYASMATLALVALLEKGELKRVVLLFGFVSGVAAFLYSYFLLWISMFLINALCPLCLLSLTVSTFSFWILLYLSLADKALGKKVAGSKPAKFLLRRRNFVLVVAVWFLLVFLAMYWRFPGLLSF